jgi:hypothetical protein
MSTSSVARFARRAALVAGAAVAAAPVALFPAPAAASPPACNYCLSMSFNDPVRASESYWQGTTQVHREYTLHPTVTITGVDNDPATPGSTCTVTGTGGAGFSTCEAGTYVLTFTVQGLGTFQHSQNPITMNVRYVARSGPGIYGMRTETGLSDGTWPTDETVTIRPNPNPDGESPA